MGETLREASERAIVDALLVNSPLGGKVDSVWTRATHFLVLFFVLVAIAVDLFQLAYSFDAQLKQPET